MYGKGDITGERFGRLVAIAADHVENGRTYWRCLCDCGKECVIPRNNLVTGKTHSCGCLRANSLLRHRTGKTNKRVNLDADSLNWIREHFKHTKNADIQKRFNVSEGWLHRFARAEGLTKSRQFMKKTQAATTAAATASHRKNGTYPPKGYKIPKSEEHQFKPGVSPAQRLGAKKEAQRRANSAATIRQLRIDEKVREMAGIPRKTKLTLKGKRQPKKKIMQRYALRRLGYIVERGSSIAYYGPDTRRSALYEGRKNGDRHYCYFDFRPIEQKQSV